MSDIQNAKSAVQALIGKELVAAHSQVQIDTSARREDNTLIIFRVTAKKIGFSVDDRDAIKDRFEQETGLKPSVTASSYRGHPVIEIGFENAPGHMQTVTDALSKWWKEKGQHAGEQLALTDQSSRRPALARPEFANGGFAAKHLETKKALQKGLPGLPSPTPGGRY